MKISAGAGGTPKYPRSRFTATSYYHPSELAIDFLNDLSARRAIKLAWCKRRGFVGAFGGHEPNCPVPENTVRRLIWRWANKQFGLELSDFETEQILGAASFAGFAR